MSGYERVLERDVSKKSMLKVDIGKVIFLISLHFYKYSFAKQTKRLLCI